jgi:hypothetical protein
VHYLYIIYNNCGILSRKKCKIFKKAGNGLDNGGKIGYILGVASPGRN